MRDTKSRSTNTPKPSKTFKSSKARSTANTTSDLGTISNRYTKIAGSTPLRSTTTTDMDRKRTVSRWSTDQSTWTRWSRKPCRDTKTSRGDCNKSTPGTGWASGKPTADSPPKWQGKCSKTTPTTLTYTTPMGI